MACPGSGLKGIYGVDSKVGWFSQEHYWLTRFCFQRAIGFLYLVAFLVAAKQYLPLLGRDGLLPVKSFLKRIQFWDAPSLLFLNCSDGFISLLIWCGLGLSVMATLGISDAHGLATSMAVWGLLWLIYLSLVNSGQVFYGYGWESLLLECGFLTIFFGSSDTRAPTAIRWMLLWVLFRLMFGAGLIKLRADPCWRDLTCMYYHFETQPLPNPLSRAFHHLPKSMLKGAVLLNHFVELVVPWFLFAPPPICYVAGGLNILFQVLLIVSGNLSWLNYLTLALCIPNFDDAFLSRFIFLRHTAPESSVSVHVGIVAIVTVLLLLLSIRPALNLFSRQQLMNASFEPFHLVNTYGAFGGITRQRLEIIIEGTNADPPQETSEWLPYEFKGKPGNVKRRPCIVAPYQYKLDWQMWFAAMSSSWKNSWILTFVDKLLTGDRKIMALLAVNPFPDKPPRFIRAELYEYQFTKGGDRSGNWWERKRVGEYLRPLSLQDADLDLLLHMQGTRQ
jgi:hypothetical protein